MSKNYFPFMVIALAAALAFAFADGALAQVNFTKADKVGNGLTAWLRGNAATVFFTVAIVIAGFAAAFNRISWMWVVMIIVGAFLVFGAPSIIANLKSSFG